MSVLWQAQRHLIAHEPQRALLVLEGHDGDGRYGAEIANLRGRALNNLRQPEAAIEAFAQALQLAPEWAEAHHNLGHVHWSLGRVHEARGCMERALALDPDYPQAWQKLGLIQLAENQPEAALESLERARALNPNDPMVWEHLGVVLQRLEMHEDALALFGQLLARTGERPEVLLNRALSLLALDRADEAQTDLSRAAELAPDNPRVQEELANAAVHRGDLEAAMLACGRCLDLRPGHTGALAILVPVLHAAGRHDEAARLQDFERFIMPVDIEPPAGYRDVEHLNAALAEHVLHHPTLTWEPKGHATKHGGHTADLLQGDKGPVAALEAAIHQAVRRYLQSHPGDPDHPFLVEQPADWSLTAWSVIMEDQGHQVPHVHPGAWLSGVYYVQIPEAVGSASDEEAPQGWIEFGRPPADMVPDADFPTEHREPVEGRMFLFPAYFYHRTVPFRGEQQRICVAFDVLRVGTD